MAENRAFAGWTLRHAQRTGFIGPLVSFEDCQSMARTIREMFARKPHQTQCRVRSFTQFWVRRDHELHDLCEGFAVANPLVRQGR